MAYHRRQHEPVYMSTGSWESAAKKRSDTLKFNHLSCPIPEVYYFLGTWWYQVIFQKITITDLQILKDASNFKDRFNKH